MKAPLLLVLMVMCNHAQAIEQFITSMSIDQHKITYVVNTHFHNTYLRDNLFVIYQHDIDLKELDYTILTMPLIMNTIAMIWVSGKDYYIDAMDEDLFTSLQIVREVFRRFYPATALNGNLIPKKLVNNNKFRKATASGIALPFSHGLDSLCTSLRLRKTPQLLITARGCPDTPLAYWDKNWEYTKNVITHFAHTHGHSTSFISSNFHDFFNWQVLCTLSPEITNWRICMIEGLGWMGLAAPILVTKGYDTFVLPANSDWTTPHPGADCPLVVDNVSFAGITNISEGFDLHRMKKNKMVARICNKHNLEKPIFIICEKLLKNRKNCCKCQKCAASILSFLLINENPQDYGFDIDIPDFLNFFKTIFIETNVYETYPADWFKYCQRKARKKFDQLSHGLQDFFAWYLTLDFDARTIADTGIIINYNDFTDLYHHIPPEVLAITHKKFLNMYAHWRELYALSVS